jgi:hypothetical protein
VVQPGIDQKIRQIRIPQSESVCFTSNQTTDFGFTWVGMPPVKPIVFAGASQGWSELKFNV